MAYDLFISYAHADDRDENREKVAALVAAIKADYLRVTGVALEVFFDTHAIRTMDDWEARILTGLRQSKMMVAVLSPSYFRSDFCRREWEIFVETELALALPGEGIQPIYVVRHPAFEADPVDEQLRHWINDLRKRQYIEWHPFWPEGAQALERADVRRKLADLPGQIKERLERAAVRDRSPNTVPLPSSHFVGRRDEMHALLKDLLQSQIGVITAVHGIPGIGKSMLAFAYAWGYGYKYRGGRFLIQAANLTDLAAGVIALAEPKGVALGDAERQNPEVALARVKAAFEAGPPALIVVDNVDAPAVLEPQSRERALPRGDHIHVLVTTRIAPDDLPRVRCLPLDALQTDDAIALLHGFRPIADSPHDDEWKAALEVANRLGCHALAVEVVAVFLRENLHVSYREFANSLERGGITLLQDQVGPEARGRLEWHTESGIARLLEPTLASLRPEELRAVEFAAFLPPDNVPLPWIRDLVQADFPALTRTDLVDPLSALLKRLERLRLIVPQVRERGSKATPATGTGAKHLARMHRLIQDVVRSRLGADERLARQERIYQHADERGEWLEIHWGRPGLAWELPCLRDLASRRISEGERDGSVLAFKISTPLLHSGRMLDVRDLWRRSAALFQRLAHAAPENADYARDLSLSYERLGDLAMSAGDTAAARRYYEDDLTIIQRLADAAPENADFARDLSVSYDRLGDLAMSAGDPAAARRYYEDGLTIAQRLAHAAPENADYARDLSISYDRLGDLARSAGDPAASRRYYEDGLTIRQRLAHAAPENADYARDLSISYERLGNLARSAGDPAAARRFYEDGLTIRQRLAHAAPENADFARALSVSYNKLGDLAMSAGDPAAARRFYEDGLTIARRLAHAAPENADFARDLSVSYERLGDLRRSAGDSAAARRFYEDGLTIRKRLANAAPGNADFARELWVSYWGMARVAESDPGADDARSWWLRVYEGLMGMKQRGMFVSADDDGYLEQIKQKLGLP